jgi:hypothetical protein
LIISGKNQAAREVALNSSVSLGRAADNTVTLEDQSVARYHAIIEKRGDGYWLSDLGSVNGTLVNGRPVAGEQQINAGDVIALGGATTIKVAAEDATGAAVATPEPSAESSSDSGLPANVSTSSATTGNPGGASAADSSCGAASTDSGLSPGLIGAAVAIGLIITTFIGLGVYVAVNKKPKIDDSSLSSPRPTETVAVRTATPGPSEPASPAVVAGSVDVRQAAQSLAAQLGGQGTNYYVFEPEFLQKIAERIEAYRQADLSAAQKSRLEIKVAFGSLNVEALYGFITALSESQFQPAGGGKGVGLWQLPESEIAPYLKPGESLADNKQREAEIAARHLRERLTQFERADFIYAIAGYRLPLGQVGDVRRKLEKFSENDRRNFWLMYQQGVVSAEGLQQVVDFFAAGIVGQNPEAFGQRVPPFSRL